MFRGIEKKHLKVSFFIITFFLLVFTAVPFYWQTVGDFSFHLAKANEKCDGNYDESRCDSYYPLLHRIGSFFAFSPTSFVFYLMFLLVFVTPLLLFYITRNWMSVWLYFSATQYVYTIQAGGAYPQALAVIFLLFFLAFKHKAIRASLLIISITVHSQAFILLLLVWTIQLFFENFKDLKNIFPACSALFGRQDVDPIGQQINYSLLNKNAFVTPQGHFITIALKDILNFFVRTFPLPFLIFAFLQMKADKDWSTMLIVIAIFYIGLSNGQARVFLVIPIILIMPLTRFFMKLSGWYKFGFIGLTIASFMFNFGTWMLYKVRCLAPPNFG